MQIQINADDVTITDALAKRINDELERALEHRSDRITRIEVHIQDTNGPKSGQDKRCVMEARPAGDDPITVEDVSDDAYELVRQTARKLRRAVERHIDRERDRRRAS